MPEQQAGVPITTPEQLLKIHDAGEGFVLNTDGRRLHAASCAHVGHMSLGTPKFFFAAIDEAPLSGGGDATWSWCPDCSEVLPGPSRLPGPRASALPAREETVRAGEGEEFAVMAGGSGVQAWSNESVQFPPKTDGQRRLKAGLVDGLARLRAGPDEVLEAVYFGKKHAHADVENLLLYNIDADGALAAASPQGLRFELASKPVPPAPSGAPRMVSYLYRVRRRSSRWQEWTPGRDLARWDLHEIHGFAGRDRTAATWWSLHVAEMTIADVARGAGQPFGVQVVVHPPHGQTVQVAGLVKNLLDGAVAALQCHSDEATLGAVSHRLAVQPGAPADDIAALLADDGRAVLGAANKLLWERGSGVQWGPADTDLVAGEVLLGTPLSTRWQISGSVVELRPATTGRRRVRSADATI